MTELEIPRDSESCVCLYCHKVSEIFQKCKCDKQGYVSPIQKLMAEQSQQKRIDKERIP